MFKDILVQDWMAKNVVSVAADTPITTAHTLMKESNIRRLPVLDRGKLVGIVTIGDIREASPSMATSLNIWEVNYLWSQIQVKEVMSKDILTVSATDKMIDAAQIMLQHKISGLPVINKKGKVVGIVTESDIFRMLVKSQTGEP